MKISEITRNLDSKFYSQAMRLKPKADLAFARVETSKSLFEKTYELVRATGLSAVAIIFLVNSLGFKVVSKRLEKPGT